GVQYFEFVAPMGPVSIGAYVGDPVGVIRGTDFKYVTVNGEKRRLVLNDGTYAISPADQTIGSQLPEWRGGVSNQFTYKNWSLNFLVDVRWGGDIFSLDRWYGEGSGLYRNTVGLNEKGNPIHMPIKRGGSVLMTVCGGILNN